MNKPRKDMYRPPDDAVWFLPLGGSGEIGMNLNLYGTKGKWLMVDCGVTFGDESTPGIEVIMPDIGFIAERKHDLVAIVITHGHEDHIGALEHLWGQLQCPIYATPFTANLIRTKIAERNIPGKIRIIEIPLGGKFSLGPFSVEFISVTHSVPESNMLAIATPNGTVLHTGDWKFDPEPLVGKVTDEERLRELGREGVMAMIGDSTNALVAGHTASEADVQKGFKELFGGLPQRIVVTCFASNIARVKSAVAAARHHHREVGLVGRSLWRNTEIAEECGYLPEFPMLLSEHDAGFMPRHKVVYVCTGSQGEVRSALARLAVGDHAELVLEKGDTVVFSSRDIPGNEKAIGRVQNALIELGVQVITADQCESIIHASGHACRDELAQLYQWVRPNLAVPVHGEIRHQTEHAALAKSCQVPNTIIPSNGQIIRLGPGIAEVVGEVPYGQWGLDGRALRPLGHRTVKDRKKIGISGAAVATVVLDKGGRLLKEPQLSLLGIVDDHEMKSICGEAAAAIADAIENMQKSARADDQAVIKTSGQALRRFLNERQGKKPTTEVHVVRI
ncbi:MAG: ribonuclease J [Alphaproteobacteria bacterium]